MKKKEKNPPRLAEWLFKRMTRYQDMYAITQDVREVYFSVLENKGYLYALFWYWYQCIASYFKYIGLSITWGSIMFKNYMKTTIRNLNKDKIYSLINIFGLSFGLVIATLIALYVQHELSFDSWHDNADRIYRVAYRNPQQHEFAVTHAALAPALAREFPEVACAARVVKVFNSTVYYKQKRYSENNFFLADPKILDIFSFKLKKGNPKTALNNPNSILISKRIAQKYFGNDDPLGKVITLGSRYVVTGVYENMPENSHFIIDLVAPLQRGDLDANWNEWRFFYTYLKLKRGTNPDELEKKFPAFLEKYRYGGAKIEESAKDTYFLQPLTGIHLSSHLNAELNPNNDIKYIFALGSFALLILIIACINYTNLVTARSALRSKEVGVRKVVGARRAQLAKQFFGEAIILTLMAALVSIIIVLVVLPYYNVLVERELRFNASFLLLFFGLTGFVGALAGFYPALLISSFKPISIIGRRFKKNVRGPRLRNILLTFQFVIFTVFIICNFIIKDQIHYLFNSNVGYGRDQIVTVKTRDKKVWNKVETIKTELKRNPDILAVSASSQLPNFFTWYADLKFPGDNKKNPIKTNNGQVDYDFVDLYGIKIIKGRNFSREFPSDAKGAFLINQTLQNALGWENPVGKELIHWSGTKGEIVGVMKDFNYQSLHNPIGPLYFFLRNTEIQYISIKINTTRIPETLAFMEKIMTEMSPGYPFEYSFFQETYRKTYNTEKKLSDVFGILMFVALIITCLGLLGLVVFLTEQRTKEIGIRKVLGANIFNIVFLLSKKFLKWILIANVIAWPLAWYVMNRWLQNFTFHIPITPRVFILSALITLLIAFITVSFRTLKTASANPVDSLRYE